MDNIGNRLRMLRKEKGKSLIDVNEDTGISYSGLASAERGEHGLRADTINTLANYYGVSVDYILCKTNDRTNEPKMAFYGGMENLTEQQKKEVLQYIEFIKSRDKS